MRTTHSIRLAEKFWGSSFKTTTVRYFSSQGDETDFDFQEKKKLIDLQDILKFFLQ